MPKFQTTKVVLRLLCSASIGVVAMGTAYAQDTTSQPQAQDDSAPGDIIVTAQRRAESARNVPISIQVLGGDDLARRGAVTTTDLAAISPTLNYTGGPSAAASAFVLRGVSSIAQLGGIQPSTGLVVDGVPVYRQGEFVADLADIQQVEILNGPQGTLFGKNATAGVINITTKAPTDILEGSIQAGFTSDGEWDVRGMVNVPFSETVRLRVNGFYDDQKPTVQNNGPAPDINGAKSYGFDAKLAIDLSDTLQLNLQGTYTHRNSSYNQQVMIDPPPFPGQRALYLATQPSTRLGFKNHEVNTDMPAIDISEYYGFSGTLKWQASDNLTLTSLTSYRHWYEDNYLDVDSTPTGYTLGQGPSVVNPLSYPIQWMNVGFPRLPDIYRYVTNETRFNYDSDSVKAVAGLFYQHVRGSYNGDIPFAVNSNYFGGLLCPAGATQADPCRSDPTKVYFRQRTTSSYTDRVMSAFGDVTFNLTEQFSIFGGLRYTNEKLNEAYSYNVIITPISNINLITDTIINPALATVGGFARNRTVTPNDPQLSKEINNLSGRVGFKFTPSDDLNIYGSYARGYKAPAFDNSASVTPTSRLIIDPEIADGFELGVKGRAFDRSLSFALNVFHLKIDGIQTSAVPPNSQSLTNVLLNAGSLTSKGVEGDFSWTATPNLRFDAGFAYNDATYGTFLFACNSTQTPGVGKCSAGGIQDIKGGRAIGSPQFKYSLGVNYHDVLTEGLNYEAQLNWVGVSSIGYDIAQEPLATEPGHGFLSGQITVRTEDRKWEFTLFGRNLTNEFYHSWIVHAPVLFNSDGTLPRDWKRYGGIKVKYNF